MLDLREKLAATEEHLKGCLASSRAKGADLGLLFYHTHPNYGQSHIYIAHNDSGEPEEDVLGQPIDYVIDYDGWKEATSWWDGEAPSGDLRLILLDGEERPISDNGYFNKIWAEQVAKQIRAMLGGLDSSLVPRRVVVCGQNGEGHSDWRPENGDNKIR